MVGENFSNLNVDELADEIETAFQDIWFEVKESEIEEEEEDREERRIFLKAIATGLINHLSTKLEEGFAIESDNINLMNRNTGAQISMDNNGVTLENGAQTVKLTPAIVTINDGALEVM